jgi:hypothetical protein
LRTVEACQAVSARFERRQHCTGHWREVSDHYAVALSAEVVPRRKDEKIAMDNQCTEQQPGLTVGLVVPLRNSSIF